MTTPIPKIRRQFGQVIEQRGKFRARYKKANVPGYINGPRMFNTRAQAEDWLGKEEAKIKLDQWTDVRPGQLKFGEYAIAWVGDHGLRESTQKLYLDSLRLHILPTLGKMQLNRITPTVLKAWRLERSKVTGPTAVRQACSIVRAVFNEAVRDELIPSSPCKWKKIAEKNPNRPYMDPDTYFQIRALMADWLHPLIDLTYAAHLRIGEVVGLQRRDLDLEVGVLRVSRQLTLAGNVTQTKTGMDRVIELPAFAVESMAAYLGRRELGLMQPLFDRPDGRPLLRSYVQRAFREAQEGIGPKPYHFHDLRHAGLTLYAQGGATLRETMDRGGHSTQRAALIYQHTATERKKKLAGNLDAAMRRPIEPSSAMSDTLNDTTGERAM